MTGPMFFQVVPALQFVQFVFKFVTGLHIFEQKLNYL
jgi:hypothetical protein